MSSTSDMEILIVEDEALIALNVREELVRAGHRAAIAVGCGDVSRLAAKAHFDLALVDIDLQFPDEGLECARLMWFAHHTPVIFVSGQVRKARDCSSFAIGVIQKPFHVEELVSAVAFVTDYLRGRRPAEERPPSLELFASATA